MSGVVTPALLSATIIAVRDDWIETGVVENARDIGDGHCYDFARAVMERLGVKGHGDGYSPQDSQGRLIDVVTEDWWSRAVDDDEAEAFHMDVSRLRAEGAPLPPGIEDDELAHLLGGMTHNWLVLDGRHYDATCPEGAEHFLLMPFFADQISSRLLEAPARHRGQDVRKLKKHDRDQQRSGIVFRMGVKVSRTSQDGDIE